MSKQLKTFFTFWGIWFVASFLNGLLSGICIMGFNASAFGLGDGTIGLTFICSFLFSAPLVGVVWLITSIALLSGKQGTELFQIILSATLVLGIIGAMFFILVLGNDFSEARFAVGLCIIISALAAVFSFRKSLKTDE